MTRGPRLQRSEPSVLAKRPRGVSRETRRRRSARHAGAQPMESRSLTHVRVSPTDFVAPLSDNLTPINTRFELYTPKILRSLARGTPPHGPKAAKATDEKRWPRFLGGK